MGRRGNTTDKYYCPKCGRKTLIRAYNHATSYTAGWECTNQPPKKWAALVEALNQDPVDQDALDDYDTYEDCEYELRCGDKKDELRLELQEKVRKYLKKRPPCDCVIFNANGTRAEISDYNSVLDKLIRPGSLIQHHLLENNNNIHRRGFEVLYSTDELDVVRHRDNDSGVAVWLYWKCTWDEGRHKGEINWGDLNHKAAAYLTHGDGEQEKTFQRIFGSSTKYALWTKPERESARAYGLRNVPFCGTLGRKKKAEIISWVKQLENSLKAYEEEAHQSRLTWEKWGRELRSALEGVSGHVSLSGFNGKTQLATITINAQLSEDQILAIAEVLRTESSS